MKKLLWISLIVSLSSCSIMQGNADNNHHALCQELKNRIVFNAATGNNTVATQQRAELEQLNKNYINQGC